MSDSVIRVENLGKCYTLSHQQQGGYKALRDVLADGARSAGKRLLGRGDRLKPNEEDFWALKDVNFEISQGDRVGIIGRNGAGKSTLLKILSRIVEPTTGEIGIRGRVASLLEVGTGFHPELTGRENIFLNGAILGMGKSEITRKFDEIVAFAEVEKFLDTPVKRYSSGMYVRLAFAVAAHLEPEILIVDEVLAVGDAQFQKKCLGKMEDVGKEGRTILFVSHNMSTIQALCSRCLLMQNHTIHADDTPAKTIKMYLEDSSIAHQFARPQKPSGLPTLVAGKLSMTGYDQALITIQIGSEVAKSVCLECRLMDELGNSIGFGALGMFNSEQMLNVQSGITEVTFTFPINYLAIGSYYISLDLTMPWTEYYDQADNCMILEIERPPTNGATLVLQQSWGKGALDLSLQLMPQDRDRPELHSWSEMVEEIASIR
jgi:lipopolysaccharide transport system ATP-binding protein